MSDKGYSKLLVLIILCSLFLLTSCQFGEDISKFIPGEPISTEDPEKNSKDRGKPLDKPTGKGLIAKDKEKGEGNEGEKRDKLIKDTNAKDSILEQEKSDRGESEALPIKNVDNVKIPINEMSEEELVEYLVSHVSEAHGYIYGHGMVANVDGNYTELDFLNAYCRDIWIGTDMDEKFTNEFLYTISPMGQIYEFDIITNDWYCASYGDRLILATVKFNEIVSEEWIELLVDDLLWIDDLDEPNGYRIENEVEKWEVLYASLWSDYYVLVYDDGMGINYYSVSMDNFMQEINNEWRQGEMLAHIYVDKGTIIYIAEKYVP